uniref:VWFA domain-containing protein n=1 Tax=Arcella intermedia TaxID=1963864 RepID=A0A6B2L0L5_9EUKA
MSKLNNNKWTCEFCGNVQEVVLEPEELPRGKVNDYLLAPPSKDQEDNNLVVFVVDISGSMTCTAPIPKGFGMFEVQTGNQKTARMKEQEELMRILNPEGLNQVLPGQRSDIQYVSRMECMQAAIQIQLEELSKAQPNCRVSLITFNDDVNVIGDGFLDDQRLVVTGDKLNHQEVLLEAGKKIDIKKLKPVSQSKERIAEQLFVLKETGATALGPGLTLAVGMASQQQHSKIILCTDGLSNVGIGSVDNVQTDTAKQFYNSLARFSKDKGVEISLIGIEGSDCGVTVLGDMALITGGGVTIVKPLELQRKMRSIIDNPVLATEVKVRAYTLPLYGFIKEANEPKSILELDVGNVTADTDVGLAFGLKKQATGGTQEVPFQVQISYKKTDGSKCLRVLSDSRPTTTSRSTAEKNADVALLALEAIQAACSRALLKKEYKEARLNLFTMQHLIDRCAETDEQQEEYDIFVKQVEELDLELKKLMDKPHDKISDQAAKVLYELKSASKSQFLCGKRKDVTKRKKHVGEIKMLKI